MPAPPILIAAPARSGTTMIAWLLHLHGVWIGGPAGITSSPETNPPVPTENMRFKKLNRSGKLGRQDILAIAPDEGRWLVKTAGLLPVRKQWMAAFPGAKWLCPQRPLEDIVQSRMHHPGVSRRGETKNRVVARKQLSEQAALLAEACHAYAYPSGVLCQGGKLGEEVAESIFDFVDIPFQVEIYREWVQPERWRRWA